MITPKTIYERLSTVMDPELGIDIVSLGLIYDVSISKVQVTPLPHSLLRGTAGNPAPHKASDGRGRERLKIHILMTLTTPGCPLAGVFDKLLKDSLFGLEGIDPDEDVTIELTFDPPWVPDMMTEEAKAELDL